MYENFLAALAVGQREQLPNDFTATLKNKEEYHS